MMGRFKYVLLLLGVALVSAGVPIAQGSSEATPVQRIAALERRVTALQRNVTTLQRGLTTLNTFRGCLSQRIAPLTQYGTADNEGYLYRRASDPTNLYLTTALDFAEEGGTPTMLVPTVNPQCVQSARLGKLDPAAKRELRFLKLRLSAR